MGWRERQALTVTGVVTPEFAELGPQSPWNLVVDMCVSVCSHRPVHRSGLIPFYYFLEETCPDRSLVTGPYSRAPGAKLRSLTLIWKFWEPVVCFERRNPQCLRPTAPLPQRSPGASPAAKLLLSLFPPDLEVWKRPPFKASQPLTFHPV